MWIQIDRYVSKVIPKKESHLGSTDFCTFSAKTLMFFIPKNIVSQM